MHRSPPALLKLVVSATLALALPAWAQSSGEWSTIAPPPPPASAPAAAAAARPAAPPPASASLPPPTVPGAPAPVAIAAPAPDAPAAKETFVPGTEPHSPGTAGNGLTDAGNLRIASGASGSTGLLHVGSADFGRAGVFRMSLLGEYFNSKDFPVLNARNTRTAGTLALDYTFHRYGEAYLSYASSANTNSKASPALMQAQGDMSLGVKGGYEIGGGLSVGADLRFEIYPGVGAQDLNSYAYGFAPRLLTTWDARKVSANVPLRLHVNAGVLLDGTGKLVTSHELTPAEEYALGINQYDRIGCGVGLEAPLPWVTPFAEWNFAYPMKAANLVGPDGAAVTAFDSMPQQLTLGMRVTAIKDVSLLAAVDLGLAKYVARGIPATQPYNVLFGVGYAFDPAGRGESRIVEKTQLVEKRVEVAAAPPAYTGKVAGVVLDAQTKQPLAGTIVAMAGSGLPPVASDTDGGKFLTHELPAGRAQLTFARDGYKPVALEANVEAGKVATLQALLVKDARGAAVKVALVSAGKKRVAGRVSFTGARAAELDVAADGNSQLELPRGHYAAKVEADGHLTKVKEFDVPEGGSVHLDIDVTPQPKFSLVVVKDDRIEIKQQVHFATAKATILRDSNQLLDQVVDAVLRNNIKKIRIEGHTDNQGFKEANLKLSAARAQAVMQYLVSKGVEASRFSSEGYGDTRPIAPNLTARGRELNRRVEFVILER